MEAQLGRSRCCFWYSRFFILSYRKAEPFHPNKHTKNTLIQRYAKKCTCVWTSRKFSEALVAWTNVSVPATFSRIFLNRWNKKNIQKYLRCYIATNYSVSTYWLRKMERFSNVCSAASCSGGLFEFSLYIFRYRVYKQKLHRLPVFSHRGFPDSCRRPSDLKIQLIVTLIK